jgi:hypothetical protein
MNRFGVFSIEDAREIHRKVFGQQPTSSPENIQRRYTTSADMYYVKMLADLPAATNPETGYTQADGLIVRYKIPAEDTLDREVAPDTAENREKITNRSTSFSAKTGDYIWVKRAGSEYIPLHSGGGQNSPSDVCPCECFDNGDMILHGIETFDEWRVSLGEQRWPQQYGVIVLPPIDFDVVWDPIRQMWVFDIGDYLEAEYPDGSDATTATVMDGEITMTWPDPASGDCCLDAILQVCVQGTVPQQPVNTGSTVGFQYGYTNGYIDGAAGNPYDDRVIFAGPTGTASGTGQYQQFGTGTNLEPATGTYGDMTGTGTGTGTFMWSDYEEGFYQGYKDGYSIGYNDGQAGPGTGTTPGQGTGTSPGAGTGGQFE